MAKDYDILIEKFRKGATTGSRRKLSIYHDAVFSYGSHFTLAVRGEFGRGIEYILNTDRRSASTTIHQEHVRRALFPHIGLLFSVLRDARIAQESIIDQDSLGIRKILAYRPAQAYQWCGACRREVGPRSKLDYTQVHLDDGSPVQEVSVMCNGVTPYAQYIYEYEAQRILFETFDDRMFIWGPVKRSGRKYIKELVGVLDVSDDAVLKQFVDKHPDFFSPPQRGESLLVDSALQV